MPSLRPADFCRQLLAALGASEGRRKRRQRDTTPDAIGMAIKRDLLERAVQENPEPETFERWLMERYSGLFRDIPNQKTGVPIGTPAWKRQLTRIVRFALRNARITRVPRHYQDDRGHTGAGIRERIEETILEKGSLGCEILGRRKVNKLVRTWFESDKAPAQVIGALYVYENYHRELGAHLRAAWASPR